MRITNKDSFPEIRSEPDWLRTWMIRLVFVGIFGLLIGLFYVTPLLFYVDGTLDAEEIIRFGIFYYPILIGISYLFLRYLKRIRGNAVRHITVNREGIFYEKLNGEVESLRYSQLERSNNGVVVDVFPKTLYRYGPTELRVFVNGREQTVQFRNTDVGYSYYSGNSRTLRSLFIQGIKLFRPDLRIAGWVYSHFYIHPETYEFDKKAYWKTIVLVIIFIVLIFLVIDWYIRHRFGQGLFM